MNNFEEVLQKLRTATSKDAATILHDEQFKILDVEIKKLEDKQDALGEAYNEGAAFREQARMALINNQCAECG